MKVHILRNGEIIIIQGEPNELSHLDGCMFKAQTSVPHESFLQICPNPADMLVLQLVSRSDK